MTEIPQLQTLINALGWMLVHFLWQGCLIAGALWVAFKLSRPESAVLRYLSGLTAFLACALVPLVTLVYYLKPAVTASAAATDLALPAFTVATGYRVTAWQFMQQGLEPALPLIVALWAVGVALLSSRTLMGRLGARRLVRTGTSPASTQLLALTEQLRQRLGVRRLVRILYSSRAAVPILVGFV